MIGKDLGDITNLANDYLPKSAIDRTTIRMAELLQHRLGASSVVASPVSTNNVSAKEAVPTSEIPSK